MRPLSSALATRSRRPAALLGRMPTEPVALGNLGRWRRLRTRRTPAAVLSVGGFMPLTMLGAALLVPLVGWLAGQFANEQLMLEARAERLESEAVAGLEQMGWQPVTSAASGLSLPVMPKGSGIEWMVASRAFDVELGHGRVTGRPPQPAKLREAMRVASAELARFPSGVLRDSGFRRILACNGLTEAGQAIPSLPNVQQSLLLDIDAPPAYLRRLLHHEIFHFIDFLDDSQLNSDPRWEALNPTDFSYGAGGRAMRRAGSAKLTAEIPGFVTEYATSAVAEDKAEVFACVMMFPGEVRALARTDPVIARKIQLLREEVQKHLPKLGRQFWDSILGESS